MKQWHFDTKHRVEYAKAACVQQNMFIMVRAKWMQQWKPTLLWLKKSPDCQTFSEGAFLKNGMQIVVHFNVCLNLNSLCSILTFPTSIIWQKEKPRYKQLNICRQIACRVVCTLTGGAAPNPVGLLIGRPFWLSLCLLFSKGLFTVPPWSLRTDSALSGVVLPRSWKDNYRSYYHQREVTKKLTGSFD